MQKKIWMSPPHMSGAEQHYIDEAFSTNWIAPVGPNIDEFEHWLEAYIQQDKKVVALHSGTSAIHLALLLAGVTKGDTVLCQSFTFAAAANPIIYLGATPVFIDSEWDTWNMDPAILEQAIKDTLKNGKKVAAILAVDSFGMPAKLTEIKLIAHKYGIPLIEDAADALGSKLEGKCCGTFGDFGIYSFNGNKIITTSGGGALVTNSAESKEKAIYYATQARENAPHYQHSEIGYNYRMSNIVAAIGRGQVTVLENRIKARREVHQFYTRIFEDIKGVTLHKEPTDESFSNYWLSAIMLESFEVREQLRLFLEKENIESRPLWKPMHLQPVFSNYPYYGNTVSEQLFERGLCLPSGSNLTIAEKHRIKVALTGFFSTSS